jgi:N-acetylmuramoyl-L-alanine amidase
MTAYDKQLPDVKWFQTRLNKHGFLITQSGEMDKLTRDVLVAFQMKYRPTKHDGAMDAETAAILDVMTSPPIAK